MSSAYGCSAYGGPAGLCAGSGYHRCAEAGNCSAYGGARAYGMMGGGSCFTQEASRAASAYSHAACPQASSGTSSAHQEVATWAVPVPSPKPLPPPKPRPDVIMRFSGRRLRNAATHVAICYHILREQRRSRNEYMPGWSQEPAAAVAEHADAVAVSAIRPAAATVSAPAVEPGSTSTGVEDSAARSSPPPARSSPPPARSSPPPTRSSYGMPMGSAAVAGCVA